MFLKVLNVLFILLEVILLFNAIIIVHELGHFLAARWRGLYVEAFGVWFGKPIWQKRINGVLYSLGSIPAGGFVKLPQLAPMDIIEGETDIPREQLPRISVIDKIIVAFAGPLFSMGLAVVLACVVWMVGRPVSEVETSTTIGFVEKGSPAEKSGLRPGDQILEVDGHRIARFNGMVNSVSWFVVRSEGETIPFKIIRDGKEQIVQSTYEIPERKGWGRKALREVGIGPAFSARVGSLTADSAAAAAGLLPGDIVTHVNGTKVYATDAIAEAIEAAPNAPVNLTVDRAGQVLQFAVTPKLTEVAPGQTRPLIGVQWNLRHTVLAYPSPVQQVVDSVTTIGNMIGALVSPKSDVKAQHFSGPVGIGRIYYDILQNENGWRLALWFSVFFNVNLAILNMLPLPVLDGGHIVLAIIEGIRRRPVNIKVLEFVQSACALLLIGYMLYVTFYDVLDLPFRQRAQEPPVPAASATPQP